jgi:hypothetical protein
MPNKVTHVPVVRQWCQSLGVLSAVSISRQEAEMKLAAYIPLLVDRFPDAAFTTASLEYVAFRASKGFPTYGELAAWLSDWWRDHKPIPPRVQLASPDMSATAQLDREQLALAAEWDDPVGIRRRIADLQNDPRWLRSLCGLVSRHAPQHLGLFPPAVLATLGSDDAPLPPPPPERPQPRYATPAQLDQINPLPGGRKRDATAAPPAERSAADPATARGMAAQTSANDDDLPF